MRGGRRGGKGKGCTDISQLHCGWVCSNIVGSPCTSSAPSQGAHRREQDPLKAQPRCAAAARNARASERIAEVLSTACGCHQHSARLQRPYRCNAEATPTLAANRLAPPTGSLAAASMLYTCQHEQSAHGLVTPPAAMIQPASQAAGRISPCKATQQDGTASVLAAQATAAHVVEVYDEELALAVTRRCWGYICCRR